MTTKVDTLARRRAVVETKPASTLPAVEVWSDGSLRIDGKAVDIATLTLEQLADLQQRLLAGAAAAGELVRKDVDATQRRREKDRARRAKIRRSVKSLVAEVATTLPPDSSP